MLKTSLYIFFIFAILIFGTLFLIPSRLFNDPESTVITSVNGELLGAKIASDGQWRFPQIDSVPYKFEKAILTFEDRYFYKHPGFNPISLLRALFENLKAQRIVSGGSTITMQTIRLSRKGKPRTIPEKILEIYLAVGIEVRLKKEEILKLYTTHAPFGGNVVGLEAASWRYFQREPWSLSWAEAATLAVLPNSPALVHPGRNPERLLEKRNLLLKTLLEREILDTLNYRLSLLEPLPEKPVDLPRLAPHLLERLHKQYPGRKIKTTVDPDYQIKLNQILEVRRDKLYGSQIYNIGCLIIENHTGNVIAYAGNLRNDTHPEYGGDVDMILSTRSTGSIMKPLLFAFMLDRGEILPGTLVPDIPTRYRGFSPRNFDRGYDGVVPARKALERSLNIPAVRMLRNYGVDRFQGDLKRLGLTSLIRNSDHYGLSLILGGAEASLWELSGIYSSMARSLVYYRNNNGKYARNNYRAPSVIYPGPDIDSSVADEHGILGAGAVYLTFKSLLEVNRPENEAGWESFYSSKPIAWKTGTSFGFRDAWAIGTNPDYVVAVWAGNASGEGRPGITGIGTAAPVMFEIFNLLPGNSWFEIPYDDLVSAVVCAKSGHRAGIHCPEIDTVWLTQTGLMSPVCPYHQTIHLSKDRKFRVNNTCYDPSQIVHASWFILPPVQEYYYRFRNPSYILLPPVMPGCPEDDETDYMQLIYPEKGSLVYIPFELEGNRGRMICEAAHRYRDKKIFWHLGNEYLGETTYIHQMAIMAERGNHSLTLIDEDGNRLTTNFEVVDRP